MGLTNQSNQLDPNERIENHFVVFVTRGQLHPEYYNALIVLATTFIMVITVSIVIQKLKSQKSASRIALYERRIKTLNFSADNDETKISLNSDVSFSSKWESSSMRYEKHFREFHSAANKCYIEKYAKYCIKVINYCPYWINVKLESAGLTPFHRVCFHGHKPLIKLMLSKGADRHLTSDAGESAICLAIYYYLHKPNSINEEYVPCLEILKRAGCRFNQHYISYDNLLQLAVQANKKELTKWLITNRDTQNSNHLERSKSFPL